MPAIALHDDYSSASYSVKDNKLPQGCNRSVQRVNFGPTPYIKIFNSYDHEMYDEIWYTAEEYDIIKARNSLLVKMMKTGYFEDSDDHSIRGLEHKLRAGHKQRRANKFNALNTVLEEQDRQSCRGIRDADSIAELYKRVCRNARENAFVLGLKDSENSFAYNPIPTPPQELQQQQQEKDGESVVSDVQSEATTHFSDVITKKKRSKLQKLFGRSSSKTKEVKVGPKELPVALPVTMKRTQRRASM